MKFRRTKSLLFRNVALLPVSAHGKRGRHFLLMIAAIFGWILAIGAFQGFLDFRSLLQTEEDWFRDDLVFLNREVKLTDSIGVTDSGISPRLLNRIRSVEGVALAEPVIRNQFPAAVQIGGGAFPMIASEIFLEAISPELFVSGVEGWVWNPGDTLVPVLIPRQFLNLYNFGFAPGKGLPPVSESTAKRVRFSLICSPSGRGTAESFQASIAGFSDQIESILVPVSFLTWANQEYGSKTSQSFGRVAISLANPDSSEFHQLLDENRLRATKGTMETARLRILLDLCLAVFGGAGTIILLLNLILFLSETESLIADHRDRIQKLYFLGHAPIALLRQFATKQIIIFTVPAVIGMALIWLSRHPITAFLRETGIRIDSSPALSTLVLWGLLVSGSILWLIWRIRGRLIQLYR